MHSAQHSMAQQSFGCGTPLRRTLGVTVLLRVQERKARVIALLWHTCKP